MGAIVVWKKAGHQVDQNEEQELGLDLDSLREWMREKIAAYKIPTHLVCLDELPKNAMGKVMKKQLVHFFGDG